MKRLTRAAVAFSALTLAISPVQAAELVDNGGFETGDFSGWTQGGNGAFTGVACNGSFTPASGSCVAYFGPVGSTGLLSQTFATTAGASYIFSYALAAGGGATNSFTASFNGNVLDSFSNTAGFGTTVRSFLVTATGATSTISFALRHDPSYYTLDNVSVAAAVPEPATWAMMIIGFGVIGGAVRRRVAATARIACA